MHDIKVVVMNTLCKL